jgi:hypothetical protein
LETFLNLFNSFLDSFRKLERRVQSKTWHLARLEVSCLTPLRANKPEPGLCFAHISRWEQTPCPHLICFPCQAPSDHLLLPLLLLPLGLFPVLHSSVLSHNFPLHFHSHSPPPQRTLGARARSGIEGRRAQALIWCGRYEEARQQAEGLLPGPDALYLESEAAWRAGHVEAALAYLGKALLDCPESHKCGARQCLLTKIDNAIQQGDLAFAEGAGTPCFLPHVAVQAVQPLGPAESRVEGGGGIPDTLS